MELGELGLDVISRNNIREFCYRHGVYNEDRIGELYRLGVFDDDVAMRDMFGVGVVSNGGSSDIGSVGVDEVGGNGGDIFGVGGYSGYSVDVGSSGGGGIEISGVGSLRGLGSGVSGGMGVGSNEVGDEVGIRRDMSYGELPEVRYGGE